METFFIKIYAKSIITFREICFYYLYPFVKILKRSKNDINEK